MLATEDPSQQQLHFLQSCGFGGLWRFAGPFTKPSVSQHQMFISFLIPLKFYKYPLSFRPLQYNLMGESSELFVNCLEAMVETCLPVEESAVLPPRPYHLSSSLSSLTLGSPTDKGNPLTKPPQPHSSSTKKPKKKYTFPAFSTESLDCHEGFTGSVSSLRRASCSKARAKHRLNESPTHGFKQDVGRFFILFFFRGFVMSTTMLNRLEKIKKKHLIYLFLKTKQKTKTKKEITELLHKKIYLLTIKQSSTIICIQESNDVNCHTSMEELFVNQL